MKIGIDARLWNESGVGRYVRNLIQQLIILDSKNEYVLFVLSKDYKNIKYQISRLQSPERSNGGQANIKKNWKLEIGNWKLRLADVRWHSLKEQIRFPQILNKEKLDLVHFTYFSVPIFYNKPFVVTIHDLILDHFPTGEASTLPLSIYKLKQLGYQLVVKRAAKKAEKVITVSKATKNEIVDHLGIDENKVVVTYEGIDEKISNVKYQMSNIKCQINLKILNTKYFLYVGNAYPHKNLERLLKAFSIFNSQPRLNRDQLSTFKLILVGKEDYFYKRLKQKVRNMGLENSVVFCGEVNDEELIQLYRGAKALIAPSLMEGFGLPALEAMANKCLVLCSDIPALREICLEAGVYFDPNNISDISDKIKNVYYNDTYHYSANIKKGFERAKMFSWKKMAKETLKIYESSSSAGSE